MTLATARRVRNRTTLGFGVALTAAMSYGAANVLTRHSVEEVSPLAGSLVALAAGTLGLLALSARDLGGRPPDARRGVLIYALAGFFSTSGLIFLFLALDRAPVALVSPVSNTYPLLTLFLAAVFLRGVERLTPRVFLGAALVVAGVAILTMT